MSSVFPDPLSGLFSVRKSQKARRISLRVVSGRLEVVLPRGVSESVVPEVLARHQKWIERHLSGFRDVHHARGAALVPDRICLVALNESFRVEIGDGGAGRVKAENVVVVPQETAHAVVGLRKWLCRVARSFFFIRTWKLCCYNRSGMGCPSSWYAENTMGELLMQRNHKSECKAALSGAIACQTCRHT